MLFNEVYSTYFNTISAILTEAHQKRKPQNPPLRDEGVPGKITERDILRIINSKAFSESMLTILPSLKNEDWLVMNRDLDTPIKRPPQMPLTLLQKRWLKSLLTDPRLILFAPDVSGLNDVEPLFTYDDFVFFDRYADGDPYTDETYIRNFRTILAALKEKYRISITYQNRKGKLIQGRFIPYQLEYSAKDDKFRLVAAWTRRTSQSSQVPHPHRTSSNTPNPQDSQGSQDHQEPPLSPAPCQSSISKASVYINLARIIECQLLDPYNQDEVLPLRRRECFVTFTLINKRNALDRIMLHFSDCRKETRRTEDNTYQVTLWYDSQDETEMLIRLLSFGPVIRITAPDTLIAQIKERISSQQKLSYSSP